MREGICKRQKTLSDALDRKDVDDDIARVDTPEHMRAHLKLVCQDGAGQWLVAPPSEDFGTLLEGELFRCAAKRRVRMKLCPVAAPCPLCGDALDSYMDHALTCSCGGDRTVRHNAVCKVGGDTFRHLGMQPTLEKPGLLPNMDEREGNAGGEKKHSDRSDRRPADIWVPWWDGGKPLAVDVAITSGLAGGWIRRIVHNPSGPADFYEEHKRQDRDTEEKCHRQGLNLLPFIVEAHSGTLGADAKKLVRDLGRKSAARNGLDVGSAVSEISMRIQATLHRETARAVLRRLAANIGTCLVWQ